MRSYFNGGGSGSSATPPPSMSGRSRGSTGQIMGARSSSASLPRSPESDLATMAMMQGSSGSGQGSLGSHGSNQEVYVNIYQNTNHPSLFVSFFPIFSALWATVWKFHHFAITQILREINFAHSSSAKSNILTHLQALKSEFHEFYHFLKAKIYKIWTTLTVRY